MRDPLAPIIAGVDFSGFVNRYSFACEPFFTDANESTTMLDGSTLHDVFPLKARFSWTLNALSAEQYAALNAAFSSSTKRDTVAAQIFDPTVNAVRSARFHVTRPAFVYNLTTQHYMSTAGSALILEDAAPRALPAVTPSPRPVDEPRDPLAPVIENYDLSGVVNRDSFQCEPFTTDGDNGGTLQDGSTVLDVLADKVRLSWTLNAISARQYADLCAVLNSGTTPDTVSASVYSPLLNAGYTAPFHVTFPVFRFALDNGQCMAFADSPLVLESVAEQWWTMIEDEDNKLTLNIFCRDAIPDYTLNNNNPWFEAYPFINYITISTKVTRIGDYAFWGIQLVHSITIPSSVSSIGRMAFSGCSGLQSMEIPDSVTSIEDGAFEDCYSLSAITIPDSVTSIGNAAFAYCRNLPGIIIPDGLNVIGNSTFRACSRLASVVIPLSVTVIDTAAFYECTGLTDVYYAGTEEQWDAIEIYPLNGALLSATVHYNSTGPT